jgi:hypothetical protein
MTTPDHSSEISACKKQSLIDSHSEKSTHLTQTSLLENGFVLAYYIGQGEIATPY